MFKSILPSAKRPGGTDKDASHTNFSLSGPEGKENNRPVSSLPQISQRSPVKSSLPPNHQSYDSKRDQQPISVRFSGPKATEVLTTDQDFEKLLDDLQIPFSLRPRLLEMDLPVKAAMLRAQTAQVPKRPKLRRSLSSNHLDSPRKDLLSYSTPPMSDLVRAGDSLIPPVAPFMSEGPSRPSSALGHSRGASLDTSRFNNHVVKPPISKNGKVSKDISPAIMCAMLAETSSTQLDVEVTKKLRIMLRNETASWSITFLQKGGYNALLTRLIEILEVEWREEQHDDQILHELLRCFKALSTSSIGCAALRSKSPTPFTQLIRLLYSDKKPGDLCTRQLIVDLLLILLEIYPTTARKTTGRDKQSSGQHASLAKEDQLPLSYKTLFSFIRSLLLTPAPPPVEAPGSPVSPHEFIASLHQPRIYKTYLRELSDICRDYFWIFCHPQNTIWNLDITDEAKIERPKAPGGMTGGVEFEAMVYLTTHFQFINALARIVNDLDLPPANELSAHHFHADLFASGLERIILVSRKASTTYYGPLHLEIARYITLASRARFDIPWTITRLTGQPPSHLLKPGVVPVNASPKSSPNKPRVAPGMPNLPSPKKVEPMKF